CFFFPAPASPVIYTFPYTTLFRSLRGAVPDGVVRRVARNPDARPLRHPDRRQSLAQSAEPPASGHHRARGADRRDLALHATGCEDRKSTRLNSSHEWISYAVFCLK